MMISYVTFMADIIGFIHFFHVNMAWIVLDIVNKLYE